MRANRPKRKAPVLSERQFGQVLAAIEQKSPQPLRDKAILALSHYSGLRAKELANITLGVLLDPTGELREVVQLPGWMTKGAKFAEIYVMQADARTDLLAWLAVRRQTATPDDARAFVSHWGRPLSADGMRQLVKAIYAYAGIQATSHTGRRTFATRLDEKDASIRVIQTLMRHNDISTTSGYIDASPGRCKAAVAKL